jgi:hypothetical protein
MKNSAFWTVRMWSLEKFTDLSVCMPPPSSELILETNRSLRNVRIFSQENMTSPQDTILKNIDSFVY